MAASIGLRAALICDQILEEADGVLSAIRIVDRFELTGQAPPEGWTLQFHLLVMVLAEAGVAATTIAITVIEPGGASMARQSMAIELPQEPITGANLRVLMRLSVKSEGLYWLRIDADDTLLARVPLRVAIQLRQPDPVE
jgi:hypothetical protein